MNDHNGKTVGYAYDEVGNQTEIVYPDNSVVKYQYDSLKRMTEVIDSDSTTKYSFDKAGRITRLAYPNSLYEEYEYDRAGQLLKVIGNDDKNVAHLQNKYEYDPQGNVTRDFRRDLIGKENQNIKYDYDMLNRLTAANEDHGLFNRNYIYDSLGNLTKENSKEKTVKYSVDGLNRLISKTENAKDTYNYAYDNRGNLIQETSAANNAVVAKYVYDATNRMVKGVNTERGSSVYNYNGLGFLTQNEFVTGDKVKKDYVLDYTAYVPRELTEYESEGIDFRNIYGYRKISVDVNGDVDGVKMFYHNDRLGSAVAVTDVKGKVQSKANYDEWGNRTQKQTLKAGARELDLTAHYATHNFDPVMDFYYAKARMYSAVDKRFLAQDPIKDGLNWYRYVSNNALKYIDPDGLTMVKAKETIELLGGSYSWDAEKGVATFTLNGNSTETKGFCTVNGEMWIDYESAMMSLGTKFNQIIPYEQFGYASELDAITGFGIQFNIGKVERGAWIFEYANQHNKTVFMWGDNDVLLGGLETGTGNSLPDLATGKANIRELASTCEKQVKSAVHTHAEGYMNIEEELFSTDDGLFTGGNIDFYVVTPLGQLKKLNKEWYN